MRFAVCRCLAVAGPIVFQDPIDDSRERTQLWPPRRRASAIPWRHRERQHLTDRLAVHTKHPRGLAGAHPLDMTRPPNPCVQLHPIHPPRLPVRATLTEGYTRSHFGPAAAGSTGRFSGGLLLCRSQVRPRRKIEPGGLQIRRRLDADREGTGLEDRLESGQDGVHPPRRQISLDVSEKQPRPKPVNGLLRGPFTAPAPHCPAPVPHCAARGPAQLPNITSVACQYHSTSPPNVAQGSAARPGAAQRSAQGFRR